MDFLVIDMGLCEMENGLLPGFGFNGERCMGNCTQALLGYELAGFPADAVCFIFDSHQGTLKVLDEFCLPGGQPSCFLLG